MMMLLKKTAGKRIPQYNDLQYTLQEFKAAGIRFKYFGVNSDGKAITVEQAEKGEKVESCNIEILHNGKLVFTMGFYRGLLQDFVAFGHKAEFFKKGYVGCYGTLAKKDGIHWNEKKVMCLIQSFFESARLERETKRALRQQKTTKHTTAISAGE